MNLKPVFLEYLSRWRLFDTDSDTFAIDAAGQSIDEGGYVSKSECHTRAKYLNSSCDNKEVPIRSWADKVGEDYRTAIRGNLEDRGTTINDATCRRVPTIAQIKAIDEEKQTVDMYLTTRVRDRDDEVIMPGGGNFDMFNLNPVVLLAHNYRDLPIGKVLNKPKSDGFGVSVKVKFADTERGQESWSLVKGGFLRTMSAGFIPDEVIHRDHESFGDITKEMSTSWPEFSRKDRDKLRAVITKWTLLEASLVSVPSNPLALVRAVVAGEIKLSDPMQKAIKLEKVANNINQIITLIEEKSKDSDASDGDVQAERHNDQDLDKSETEEQYSQLPTIQAVASVDRVISISRVVTTEDIKRIVQDSCEKTLARMRGVV